MKESRLTPSLRPQSIVVAVVGLGLTGLLTWAAAMANQNDSNSVLQLQVRQVASTLSTALPSVESQLADALTVATTTNSPSAFQTFVSGKIQPAGYFASVSLWQRTATGATLVVSEGAEPQLVLDGGADAFFAHLRVSPQLQVTGILGGSPPRIGYADAAANSYGYIVYAESLLPAGRKITVPSSSPFGQLNYAVYLGHHETEAQLIGASVPTPIQGMRATASVPFGDTTITVVGTPNGSLTGTLSSSLPWIVLAAGTVLSLGSAATVEYVARRRRAAERMGKELTQLYAEQRTIAETLQQALLPQTLPEIEGMDVAARYLPGSRGMDIGGDWYDFVVLDKGRFVFIVGDVSGRGVAAAAVMGSLRFSSRGFALERHPPSEILTQLRKTLDLTADGHFATVLCGLVDVERHEVTLANAGHLPPVLVSGDGAEILAVPPAAPIGVATEDGARPVVVTVGAGSALVAFTDGLVERRDEDLDDSMRRLERAAGQSSGTLDQRLGSIVTDMTLDAPQDDVALIGFRWQA
jgi:Stage II sporulation protein E (SpoIIE)